MRDTPETDAAIIDELDVELEAAGRGHWRGDTKMELLPADFARKLERERDEAQAAFAIATDQLVVAQSQARQWHQCAKKLAPFVVPIPADMADHTACVGALAEFERLKEDGK